MNANELEYRRFARDMAELLWRNRAGSIIFALLKGNQLAGRNDEDQHFAQAWSGIEPAAATDRIVDVHWISSMAQSFLLPQQSRSILYVVHPNQYWALQDVLLKQTSLSQFVVERGTELALLLVPAR